LSHLDVDNIRNFPGGVGHHSHAAYSYVNGRPLYLVDPLGLFDIKATLRGAGNALLDTGRALAPYTNAFTAVIATEKRARATYTTFKEQGLLEAINQNNPAYALLVNQYLCRNSSGQTAGYNCTNTVISAAELALFAYAGARTICPITGRALPASSAKPGNPPQQSPHIDPRDVIGRTPSQIDAFARQKGLIAKGADPAAGRGAYIDPITGKQRILCSPGGCPPHAHVNNSSGERLNSNGDVVGRQDRDAHLPITIP
jgi:hypothetical protein